MTRSADTFVRNGSTRRPAARRGLSMLDLFVSLALLVTLISVATPLVVRHGRLLKSQRNYRLALDELSNQLELLNGLRSDELPDAVKRIAPSPFVAERLSGARLTGKIEPAEVGGRVTLQLAWNEIGRRDAPVSLSAWILPVPGQSHGVPEEGGRP